MIMMMTAPVMDTSGGISLPVLFQSTSVITGAELRTDTDRGGSTMTESERRRKMNTMHKYKLFTVNLHFTYSAVTEGF